MAGDLLKHYGVLGMRWGVRKSRSGGSRSSSSHKPTSSSETQPESDHQRARTLNRKGVKNLSNKELQDVLTRMNLERQYKTLNPSPSTRALNLVKSFTSSGRAVSDMYDLSKSNLYKDMAKSAKKRTKKKAAASAKS